MLPSDPDAAYPQAPPPVVPADTAVAVLPTPEHGIARFHIYWTLAFAVIVLDQLTKALVRVNLPLYDSVTIIPGFIELVHVHNSGVAFGLMNGGSFPFRSLLTSVLAVGALLCIGIYARHIRPEEKWARAGLSLILGGAVGNLIDRLWAGYVVDFVDAQWRGWHFWAFNLADASISIGAVLVFIDLLLVNRHASHSV